MSGWASHIELHVGAPDRALSWVVALLASNFTNKEIAAELGLELGGVKLRVVWEG